MNLRRRKAMGLSIKTNQQALVALQFQQLAERQLGQTQNRVSTGLKVTGAVDDASTFAVAQGVRSELKAYLALDQAKAQTKGLLTVANAGIEKIWDTATELKKKIIEGNNPALTAQQRQLIEDDVQQLRELI